MPTFTDNLIQRILLQAEGFEQTNQQFLALGKNANAAFTGVVQSVNAVNAAFNKLAATKGLQNIAQTATAANNALNRTASAADKTQSALTRVNTRLSSFGTAIRQVETRASGVSASLNRVTSAANSANTALLGTGRSTQQLNTQLAATVAQLNASASAMTRFAASVTSANVPINNVSIGLGRIGTSLRTFAIAIGAGISIRGLIDFSDELTTIRNRITTATKSAEEWQTVWRRLVDISVATGSSLEANSEAFLRLQTRMKDVGFSAEETIRLIDVFNKSMVLSGSSVLEASQAIRQFTQALGKGRAIGDEFITMMEAMPLLANAVAKELGTTTIQLTKLSKEGAITTQVMIRASKNMEKELTAAFSRITPTIEMSFNRLHTQLLVFANDSKVAGVAAREFAGAIDFLANHLDAFANIVSGIILLLGVRGLVGLFRLLKTEALGLAAGLATAGGKFGLIAAAAVGLYEVFRILTANQDKAATAADEHTIAMSKLGAIAVNVREGITGATEELENWKKTTDEAETTALNFLESQKSLLERWIELEKTRFGSGEVLDAYEQQLKDINVQLDAQKRRIKETADAYQQIKGATDQTKKSTDNLFNGLRLLPEQMEHFRSVSVNGFDQIRAAQDRMINATEEGEKKLKKTETAIQRQQREVAEFWAKHVRFAPQAAEASAAASLKAAQASADATKSIATTTTQAINQMATESSLIIARAFTATKDAANAAKAPVKELGTTGAQSLKNLSSSVQTTGRQIREFVGEAANGVKVYRELGRAGVAVTSETARVTKGLVQDQKAVTAQLSKTEDKAKDAADAIEKIEIKPFEPKIDTTGVLRGVGEIETNTTTVFDNLKTKASEWKDAVVGFFGNIGTAITETMTPQVDKWRTQLDEHQQKTASFRDTAIEFFRSVITAAGEYITAITNTTSAYTNLGSTVSTVMSSIVSAVGNAITAMNNLAAAARTAEAAARAAQAAAAAARAAGAKMASGGPILGPGTATSDSVGPFMLSRGEYVMPAPSVMLYGQQLFDMLRARLLPRNFWKNLMGLRLGGPIFPTQKPMFGMAAGGPVLRQPLILNLSDGSRVETVIEKQASLDSFIKYSIRKRVGSLS